MVMRRGKRVGRKGRKPIRRVRRVPRAPRRNVNVPDVASLTETKAFSLLNTGQMYQMYNVQLSQFPRAALVAQGYQYYRIKSIKLIWQPLIDTFINPVNVVAPPAQPNAVTVPYLYYMIDRTKQLSTANYSTALKKTGAKARRLDDKIVTATFKPSVLNAAFDSAPPVGQSNSQFVQYKTSPWLCCRDQETTGVWNADSTDHGGIVWYCETSAGATCNYKLDLEIQFEFKKPSYGFLASTADPAPVDIIELATEEPPTD